MRAQSTTQREPIASWPGAEAMTTIRFRHAITSTPEGFVAVLTDFGPGGSKVFGYGADEHL
ncbi:MAG: hypothetical protein JWQ76_2442 [Ramlibacter sp.]|nr:hypothetical protein [Ramlibacter sp.]